MEGDDERGQAAVLRGTVAAVQVAHGEAPGLPVPAAAEAHVHRGRQEDAHIRVQDPDAAAAQRDAAAVVQGRGRGPVRRRRRRRRRAGRGGNQFRVSARRVHVAGRDVLAGQLAVVRRRQPPRRRLDAPSQPPYPVPEPRGARRSLGDRAVVISYYYNFNILLFLLF